MIRLPRPMKDLDIIEIKGEVLRKERIVFALCHENSSPAGQIEINFTDHCIYEYKDGNKNIIANDPADLITGLDYTLSLTVEGQTDNEYSIWVKIGETYDLCAFNVSNISSLSYLDISDDVSVKSLCFKY